MLELIIVITLLLAVSFLCSILESVILSITRPYIQTLISRHSRTGKLLSHLKENIDQPISAILTLNTISHTVGAAVSGAIAIELFGSKWMAAFSAILTFLILIFSEIIPKTLGAHYWKELGPLSAYILKFLIYLLKPLIIPIHFVSRLFAKGDPGSIVSREEIINYIRLGYFQGIFESPEYNIMENLFLLETIRTRDIMTPRTVVFWLDKDWTVEDIIKNNERLQFSRIPLYDPRENKITGIVLRRDIMNHIADKKLSAALSKLAYKPNYVIETITVYKLLNHFITNKLHISIVLNEFGDYTGIVTMEDAIETLLGVEIIDEFDPAVDMQQVAEKLRKRKFEKKL